MLNLCCTRVQTDVGKYGRINDLPCSSLHFGSNAMYCVYWKAQNEREETGKIIGINFTQSLFEKLFLPFSQVFFSGKKRPVRSYKYSVPPQPSHKSRHYFPPPWHIVKKLYHRKKSLLQQWALVVEAFYYCFPNVMLDNIFSDTTPNYRSEGQ